MIANYKTGFFRNAIRRVPTVIRGLPVLTTPASRSQVASIGSSWVEIALARGSDEIVNK
jgi:hypothetical protein